MLADAKTYLNKNNIPLTDANFTTICEMLAKDLKYCYLFTHFHYVEKIPVSQLQELYNTLRALKDHLSKISDITTYRSWQTLQDDLAKLKEEIVLKKFFNLLPSELEKATIEFLKPSIDPKIEKAQLKFKDVATKFMLLNECYRKDFTANISRLTTPRQITTALNAYLKFIETGKDFSTIKKTWQDIYGLKKVYEDDKIFLAEATELETIKQVGTTSWCIARDFGHWRSYVGREHARQYVLWNSHAAISSPDYQIAFTLYKDISLTKGEHVAHNRRNTSIKLEAYFKKYNIEFLIKHFAFKTVDVRVTEGLEYFSKFPKKKNDWTNYRFEQINFYDIGVIKNLTTESMLKVYENHSDACLYRFIDSSTKTSGAVLLYYLFLSRLENSNKFWSSFFLRTPQFYKEMVDRPEPRKFYKAVLSSFLNKKHERALLNSFESFLSSANSHYRQNPTEQMMDFWTDMMPDIYTFVESNKPQFRTKEYLTSFVYNLKGRNAAEIETRKKLGVVLNIKEAKKVEEETKKPTTILERFWKDVKSDLWKVDKKKPKTISPSASDFITAAIYSLLDKDKE